jgi:hypothetical protein
LSLVARAAAADAGGPGGGVTPAPMSRARSGTPSPEARRAPADTFGPPPLGPSRTDLAAETAVQWIGRVPLPPSENVPERLSAAALAGGASLGELNERLRAEFVEFRLDRTEDGAIRIWPVLQRRPIPSYAEWAAAGEAAAAGGRGAPHPPPGRRRRRRPAEPTAREGARDP